MLHEKPNESFHWKDKLNELDHVPGEPLRNKTALWEKLHNRLREKPVSRKAVWYWLAAACILIAAGILWIMPNVDNDLAKKEIQRLPEQLKRESQVAKEEKALFTQGSTTALTTKKSRVVVSVNKETRSNLKTRGLNETPVKDSAPIQQFLPMTIVHSNEASDTITAKEITVAAVTKKLRIVHINEIVTPAEEMPFAKVMVRISSQRKLSDQNEVPAFSLSKNASDNLVKIKIFPSN